MTRGISTEKKLQRLFEVKKELEALEIQPIEFVQIMAADNCFDALINIEAQKQMGTEYMKKGHVS